MGLGSLVSGFGFQVSGLSSSTSLVSHTPGTALLCGQVSGLGEKGTRVCDEARVLAVVAVKVSVGAAHPYDHLVLG